MRARGGIISGAAVLLLAGVPVSAAASTTVGSSLRQRADLYVRCSTRCTELQVARPGGASLRIAADGIISRWRLRAGTLGTVRLRVLRPRDDASFETVAVSEPVRLARAHRPGQDVLYRFAARIAVREGDRLALDHDAAAGGVFHSYGQDTAYQTATFAPQPDAGPASPTSTGIGRELLLAADVERDVDGDGFGDETQDNCPTIANDQTSNPCPPGTTVPGSSAQPGSEIVPGPAPAGTQGSLVAGERRTDRSTRAHRGRPAARPSPQVVNETPSAHRGRPPPRPGPKPRSRRDAATHADRPAPRATPAPSKHDQTTRHGGHPTRPAPKPSRRPDRLTHTPHPRARPAPAPRKHTPTRLHRRHPARPAPPPPRKSPGFHAH